MDLEDKKIPLTKEQYKKLTSKANEPLSNIGKQITVRFEGDTTTETFKLLENNIGKLKENEISIDSPLGKSVLNALVNDIVTYQVNNTVFKVEVIKISA